MPSSYFEDSNDKMTGRLANKYRSQKDSGAINELRINPLIGEKGYSTRPQGTIIDTIVIHYTVFDYEKSVEALTKSGRVSAHYLIREDGHIDQIVPDQYRAWHAGESAWDGRERVNDFSIGIELVNAGTGEISDFPLDSLTPLSKDDLVFFPEEQMKSLVLLLDYLKQNHPEIRDKNIIGHSDICAATGRKIDPGVAFDWNYLALHGHGLYSDKEISDPMIVFDYQASNDLIYNEEVMKLQLDLQSLGYVLDITGLYDEQTASVVRAFNMHHNKELRLGLESHNNQRYSFGQWDEQSQARLGDMLGLEIMR